MSEGKSAKAYRTISEVAESLGVPQHVLRFWETKFPAVKPLKRGGNRRYYRPEDIELLQVIHRLLHVEGYTIKGAQKLLKEQGARPLVEALLGSEEPVPLALSAAAMEAEGDEDAGDEGPAAAAGETPGVDAAVLSAERTAEAPTARSGALAEPEEIAVAAAVMPVEALEAESDIVANIAPERPPERAEPFGGGEPPARQPRGALVDERLIAELRAIRAQLAEALAAATPAAR